MLISFLVYFFTAFSETKKGFNHFFTTYVGFAGGDAFCFRDEH